MFLIYRIMVYNVVVVFIIYVFLCVVVIYGLGMYVFFYLGICRVV